MKKKINKIINDKITLILANDDFDVKFKVKGKKSLGMDFGALNSNEPVLLVESMIGSDHTNWFLRVS